MAERVRPAGDWFGDGRHLKFAINGASYPFVGDWSLSPLPEQRAVDSAAVALCVLALGAMIILPASLTQARDINPGSLTRYANFVISRNAIEQADHPLKLPVWFASFAIFGCML